MGMVTFAVHLTFHRNEVHPPTAVYDMCTAPSRFDTKTTIMIRILVWSGPIRPVPGEKIKRDKPAQQHIIHTSERRRMILFFFPCSCCRKPTVLGAHQQIQSATQGVHRARNAADKPEQEPIEQHE